MEKERMFVTIAAVSGLLSVLFYILHDVIGGLNYPGYDWMTQAVSDLTATDAPSYAIASALSAVYGVFSCICCILLSYLTSDKRAGLKWGILLFTIMELVSAAGYTLFPLSSAGYDGSTQSFIHDYVITVLVVLLSIISLALISIGGHRDNRKVLYIVSVLALLCMFFGAAGSGALPQSVFGIIERFSTYSAVVFTGFLGIYWYLSFTKGFENSE